MRQRRRREQKGMSLNTYQNQAMRTASTDADADARLDNAILGLAGETGEILDHIKKYRHQGHALDRDHLMDETGDVLWYVALLCDALGVTLNHVAAYNIEKLRERYPHGFDAQRSINREDD